MASKGGSKEERTLWRWFSIYIRLRDASTNGYCKCFTCPMVKPWRQVDCGHGISRSFKATKYHEQNNHAQCKGCNGFRQGRQAIYAKNVDRVYGFGTWEKLEVLSRAYCKRGKVDFIFMAEHYKTEAHRIAKEKGIQI
jgi:hypothetical protein